MISIINIGMNHESAPVELRECLAGDNMSPADMLSKMRGTDLIMESIFFSTCNRIEVLCTTEDIKTAKDLIISLMSQSSGVSVEDIKAHMYIYQDMEAVKHIFRVASSLDSMVVGEAQILGQVKEAYRQAHVDMSKAQDYSGGMYPDLEPLIEEARFKGISRVHVMVNNMSHVNLDPVWEQDLLEIDTRGFENEWVEYHFKHLNEDIAYDYTILVNLESIAFSPDEVKEKDNLYKKKVEDGFDYVLDANGNVMKDTAGNGTPTSGARRGQSAWGWRMPAGSAGRW